MKIPHFCLKLSRNNYQQTSQLPITQVKKRGKQDLRKMENRIKGRS